MTIYDRMDGAVLEASRSGFFGTMYGEKYEPGVEIIHLAPGAADVGKDGALWYVWGYPGPDYNRYAPEDYGKTWALAKEELIGNNNKSAL